MSSTHQEDGGLADGLELGFPDVGDGEEIELLVLSRLTGLLGYGVDRMVAVAPLAIALVVRIPGCVP